MLKDFMTIRQATANDRDEVKKLWKETLEDAFIKQKPDKYHNVSGELAFKMRQYDEALNHTEAQYFLASIDEEVIGSIAYSKPPNPGILTKTNNDLIDTVEVGSLYIKPSYQNKGYGKRLLIYIYQHLSQLEVDTVCFDSIIESSKQRWLTMFGKPKYQIPSKKHDFIYMVWVIKTKEALEKLQT